MIMAVVGTFAICMHVCLYHAEVEWGRMDEQMVERLKEIQVNVHTGIPKYEQLRVIVYV